LKARKNDSDDKAGFGAMDHAGRRVPVPDRYHNGYRRGDERDIEQNHGKENQGQGDIVVTGSLPFDVFDLFPRPAGFKTSGTEMLATKVAITEGAHKSAASEARQDSLLRRVIETGGLSFQQDIFGGLRGTGGSKVGREQFFLQKTVAA
jgi:hypothetical protein